MAGGLRPPTPQRTRATHHYHRTIRVSGPAPGTRRPSDSWYRIRSVTAQGSGSARAPVPPGRPALRLPGAGGARGWPGRAGPDSAWSRVCSPSRSLPWACADLGRGGRRPVLARCQPWGRHGCRHRDEHLLRSASGVFGRRCPLRESVPGARPVMLAVCPRIHTCGRWLCWPDARKQRGIDVFAGCGYARAAMASATSSLPPRWCVGAAGSTADRRLCGRPAPTGVRTSRRHGWDGASSRGSCSDLLRHATDLIGARSSTRTPHRADPQRDDRGSTRTALSVCGNGGMLPPHTAYRRPPCRP